ncbi:MAG: TIGR03663 family protein, partial [Melioribacteraceae bacterium]|nr:TIGR03663 family protein [Melioribacteraceae bacterium]
AIMLTLLIRFYDISDRPMHNDEAVNSLKFEKLLVDGDYVYDPTEYHGPTLYYFTLIGAWISGVDNFEDVSETLLRSIPIIFSLLFLLFLYLMNDILDRRTLVIASLFLIISPFINFYSRYYIHESIFAALSLFLLFSLFKFFNDNPKYWGAIAGTSAALLYATKETSVIVFFALFISIIITKAYKWGDFRINKLLWPSVIFILVSVIFYSSFFTNPHGIQDSVLTYLNYFLKSSSISDHTQPWYYYLSLFTYNNFDDIIITEIVIFILGIIGIYSSYLNKGKQSHNLSKFISIFTITYFIVFSVFQYKTPWNIFTAWVCIVILSGFGFSFVLSRLQAKSFKVIFIILIILSGIHLGYQTYITSYLRADKPNNPFTYSQPTKEIYELTDLVSDLINFDNNMLISIVAEDNQYWPLPWYFRSSKHTAWNSAPKDDLYKFDLIITEPKFIDEITNILYTQPEPGQINLYIPLLDKDIPIRPGKYFSAFIKNDFYQRYRNRNTKE